MCLDSCNGCSVKLLEFLESELQGWEARLRAGEQSSFGDLLRLAKVAGKVHAVLERNGLV